MINEYASIARYQGGACPMKSTDPVGTEQYAIMLDASDVGSGDIAYIPDFYDVEHQLKLAEFLKDAVQLYTMFLNNELTITKKAGENE